MNPLDLAFDVIRKSVGVIPSESIDKSPAQYRDAGGKKKRGVPNLPSGGRTGSHQQGSRGPAWERGVNRLNLDMGDLFEEGANIHAGTNRGREAMSVDHVARKRPTSAAWGGTRKNPIDIPLDAPASETDIYEYNSDTGKWEPTEPEMKISDTPEFTITNPNTGEKTLGPRLSKPTGRRSLTGVGKRKYMGELGLNPDASMKPSPRALLPRNPIKQSSPLASPPPQQPLSPPPKESLFDRLSNVVRRPLDEAYQRFIERRGKEEPEEIPLQINEKV